MSVMSEYSHTLIASVGGQPQIVTLTLDLLLRQHIKINEVIVLHPAGRDERIQNTLRCLRAEFAHDRYLCDGQEWECHVHLQAMNDEQGPLPDITNTSGAQAARDILHRLLYLLKQQRKHIHLSVSGGRRVISLMAISAAQLHFDHADHIWHIYTPAELLPHVREGKQMHLPANSGVALLDVPFVPWGAYFPQLSQIPISARHTQDLQVAMMDSQERARCAQLVEEASKAQQKVLRQISIGHKPREIAEHLSLSIETVYSHTKVLLQLARNIWCLPEKEPVNSQFLHNRFAHYFSTLT
jgi:CRISPR-associated protein Csx14